MTVRRPIERLMVLVSALSLAGVGLACASQADRSPGARISAIERSAAFRAQVSTYAAICNRDPKPGQTVEGCEQSARSYALRADARASRVNLAAAGVHTSTTQLKPLEGIINHSTPPPCQYSLTFDEGNAWRGYRDGKPILLLAGATLELTSRGPAYPQKLKASAILEITYGTPEGGCGQIHAVHTIDAPAGNGVLRFRTARGSRLTVSNETGANYTFDVTTLRFLASR